MTLVRKPASGARPRARSISARKSSVPPNRRIRRSSVGEECWKDRSKYGATRVGAGDHLEQARPQLGRLQVGHPHPRDALDRGQLRQQLLQRAEVAEVLAVGGGVLADQHQLGDALRGQPLRLAEHLGRRAGDERAAEGGDGAERAAPVAARGQLQRGGRAGGQPLAAQPVVAGDRRGVRRRGRRGALDRADRQQRAAVARGVRHERAAGEDVVEPVADGAVVVEAEDRRLGQRPGQLRAVPLGHAADGDDGRAGVGRGEDRVDRVLLGGLDEAAGVHQDGVGAVGVVHQLVALGGQPPGQLLGVDLVARAAEGHHRHSPPDGNVLPRRRRQGVAGGPVTGPRQPSHRSAKRGRASGLAARRPGG